ncbi:MAG: CapA family protein [Tissierellia bacterium]|nr:CapA family protein [Tissierellia bacterium]
MLQIVGDINLTDNAFDVGIGVGSSIKEGKNPFERIKKDNSDVWIGNFEGVSSSVSDNTGIAKRQFNLEPQFLNNFENFDIYNIANNHSMEHGSEAFIQTVKNLNHVGAKVFGTQEKPTVQLEHKGKKWSITGFCQRKENSPYVPLYWYNPDLSEIKREYQKISSNDYKIAYIHWGNEFVDRPYNDQRLFAHALIDIGFDIIIGMHPHLLQGYEVYKNKRIYYSIGNFVFNMGWEPLQYGAIIHLDSCDDQLIVSHSYVHIEDDFFPIIIKEQDVPRQYRFDYLNTQIKYDMSNEEYYNNVRKRTKVYHKYNRKAILRGFLKMNIYDSFLIIKDFFIRHL